MIVPIQNVKPRAPSWRILLLAFVPLAVLYPLAIMALSQQPANIATLGYSLVSIGLAGALAGVSWWIAARYPWPEHASIGFYGAHLAGGLTYAVVWWVGAAVVRSVFQRNDLLQAIGEAFTSRFFPWNLLFGVLIYGFCVGLSYAVRSQEAIREHRIDAARAEAVAARAQLTALQARLNPHFLFNALHSLAGLIRIDPGSAETGVDRLGDLFRYALDNSGSEAVPLRDEWSFVEDYLAIEQLRLGSRLRLTMGFDPDISDALVPPFCLQPLVENAVRHGIAPLAEGGTVTIVARKAGDRLQLEVTDDGAGASAEALGSGGGFGLHALRQHLENNTLGAGRLQVEATPGIGCRARVSLPLRARPIDQDLPTEPGVGT